MRIKKIKILFIIPTLTGGGAERVITTLLNCLDRKIFSPVLAVVDTRDAVFKKHLPTDIELIDLQAKRVIFSIPKLLRLIWSIRPDIVFSTLSHLNLAMACIRFALPRKSVYIARETIVVSYNIKNYECSWLWALAYKLFYHNYDLVICQSLDMKNDLIKSFGFPDGKAVTIHNPLDIDAINTSKLASGSPYTSGPYQLVTAGRLVSQKGFDLLINALSLLGDKNIHLTVLGVGSLESELKQLASWLEVGNKIDFVGFQNEPYHWFANADAFILSSRYEGFPNVVLEALACGTPVIATPAPGGVKEILSSIKECVIAEDISAESLAKAIDAWLSGERKRVNQDVVSSYDVSAIVKRYEQVFISMMDR